MFFIILKRWSKHWWNEFTYFRTYRHRLDDCSGFSSQSSSKFISICLLKILHRSLLIRSKSNFCLRSRMVCVDVFEFICSRLKFRLSILQSKMKHRLKYTYLFTKFHVCLSFLHRIHFQPFNLVFQVENQTCTSFKFRCYGLASYMHFLDSNSYIFFASFSIQNHLSWHFHLWQRKRAFPKGVNMWCTSYRFQSKQSTWNHGVEWIRINETNSQRKKNQKYSRQLTANN